MSTKIYFENQATIIKVYFGFTRVLGFSKENFAIYGRDLT